MIDALALDYACTRATARLAWRPDERLWQRLRAARGLRALLDTAHGAAVGNYLTGLSGGASCAEIDVAFRAQFRARVGELAGWAPTPWRPAVLWATHLLDIAVVGHLWTQAPLRWMQSDPVLARYAAAGDRAGERRAALVSGPLAPLGRALARHAAAAGRTEPDARLKSSGADPAPLPTALAGWLAHWRSLWPAASPTFSAEQRAALERLRDDVLAHRRRFAQLPPADTGAAREALATRVLARMRMDPVQPVSLFAYLVVLAIDVERLRAECLVQAFDAAHAPTAAEAA